MFPLCAEDKIAELEVEIREVVSEVKQLKGNPVDASDPGYKEWREDLNAARGKEKQLREEKKQLNERLLIKERQAPQGVC